MSRQVLTVDLRDDPAAIASYRDHHQRVWPEVLASVRQAEHTVSHPRVLEWERLMQSLQAPAAGAPPGDWWSEMEPNFPLP